MPTAETARLVAELTLKDKLSGGVRSAIGGVDKLDKAFGRTQKSLGKFGGNIQKGLIVGATAAAGGLALVVNAARDYETAFAGVRKTVNATEPELKALSDGFRAMAREIPISAAELASLGETAGALGIEGTKNIQEFVRVTALLGVTTDLTSQDAATSLGIIANVLHLTSDEYSKFASSLVALGNAGASTESQIIEIAQRAGAAGELIGISTSQVLGFSSAVASLGIDAEAGGSAIQKFFIDSAKSIAGGGTDLAVFAKTAGVSAKTFAAAFKKDAGAALQSFLAGLGKLDQAAQLDVLDKLGFTDVRITRTLLGLANNTKLVADQMGVANTAFGQNTALTKEAQQRFNTFDSQLQITKNTLTDIGITIGSKLLPKITPLLKRLNEFVTANQGKIEQFGDDLAAGFERFADAVGKVDWRPFVDGLKTSVSLAKGAFDAFNALPDDFKKLILVGAGINKITGGLLTSFGADLAGAFGKQFLARGSNPANPLFVADVTGGFGGGGLAGAAGGGIKGLLLRVLPPALIAAGLIEAIDSAVRARALVEAGVPIPGAQGQFGPRTAAQMAHVQAAQGAVKLTPDSSTTVAEGVKAGMAATKDELISGRHEAARLSHAEIVAFRDNKFNKADIAAIPKILDFYKGSVHPSEKSIATDIAKLQQIEAAYTARGDTKTAALVAGAIKQLQITQVGATVQSGMRSVAAIDAAKQAIRDKDLSVTVNNPISITVKTSIREQNKGATTYQSYYKIGGV